MTDSERAVLLAHALLGEKATSDVVCVVRRHFESVRADEHHRVLTDLARSVVSPNQTADDTEEVHR